MILARVTTLTAFVACAAMGALVGTPTPASAEDPEPCTAKKFQFDAVKKACAEGGRPKAKAMMKAVVKKAKAAGESMKCTTCHKDAKNFALKDDAGKLLKKWL